MAGERGRKPSEKEEYKEGTMRRRKRRMEEGRKTHCNASFTLVRPPGPDPPPSLPPLLPLSREMGLGRQFPVQTEEGGDVQLS